MPLATFPGRGPITTHLEGAPFPREMSQSECSFVQNQSPTKLQCTQDVATVVPVNDTQTQCTIVSVFGSLTETSPDKLDVFLVLETLEECFAVFSGSCALPGSQRDKVKENLDRLNVVQDTIPLSSLWSTNTKSEVWKTLSRNGK